MAARSPLTEKQLRERDAKRDLGVELLLSVRQMKAGLGKVVTRVEVPLKKSHRLGNAEHFLQACEPSVQAVARTNGSACMEGFHHQLSRALADALSIVVADVRTDRVQLTIGITTGAHLARHVD